jgi:predicted ATPase
MKLRSLTVRNFRGIREKTLSFLDAEGQVRPLTVLAGPNRTGKTTLLDAIHLVAAAVENARAPMFRPEFNPDDPRLRPDPSRPIEVGLTFSLEHDEWRALVDVSAGLGDPVPEYAESYTLEFAWPRPEGSEYGVVAQAPPGSALGLRGRARAKVALAQRKVTDALFEQLGGVLYLDQHRSVEMTTPITRTAQEIELARQASAGDILPWMELQARLALKWDAAKGESRWAHLRRTYADLAWPSTIDDIEAFSDGFDLRMRDASTGQTYYAAGTSSGERQLLRMAANLVAWRAYRSVVLIDEVELHLHPRWQRDLLHFCRRGGGGHNQFIVTTHSEAILSLVDPDAVVALAPLAEAER